MKITTVKPHGAMTAALCLAAALYAGCNNKPLLSEMGSNRLLIVLKGTYETNNPRTWRTADPNSTTAPNGIQDDSVDDISAAGDIFPSAFMIDLAELKLVDARGKIYNFSKYRQTITAPLVDGHPFFNGVGWVMVSDDVPSGAYVSLGMYIRKMLFDKARVYYSSGAGWSSSDYLDMFAENYVTALNFNQFQTLAYFDTLRIEQYYLNRVYPLTIPIQNYLVFNKDYPYTVLEIRIVIKNFIKKYEYERYDENGIFSVVHYYAFSDWLRNVRADETVMGGNIITAARSYIPGLAGRITGTNGDGVDRYIIAIPAGDSILRYTQPVSNPRGSDGAINCDFPKPPGLYLGLNPEPAIDYYLNLEKWKTDYTTCVNSGCNNFVTYQNQWDAYINNVQRFTLPPVATFAAAGTTYSLENLMPGNYTVYSSIADPNNAALFTDGQFTSRGTVAVTAGGTAGLSW